MVWNDLRNSGKDLQNHQYRGAQSYSASLLDQRNKGNGMTKPPKLHYRHPDKVLPECMEGATLKTFLDMNFKCAGDNDIITCIRCLEIGYGRAIGKHRLATGSDYGKLFKP